MPHRLRKVRKRRGSRTHGYGRVGQHRAGGQRGGHGRAGLHKHKWTYTIKHEPDYFGKTGFTSIRGLRRENVMNVGTLDQVAERLSTEKRKTALLIDLQKLGYTKLLGSGNVTKKLVVKVQSCSKTAAQKIQEAGGEVLIGSKVLESTR